MPSTPTSAKSGHAVLPGTGCFITLEGIDGAGKSTHLDFLAGLVRERGVPVTLTREPGGTELGETLRDLLLHKPMHQDTEAMLMFAGRSEHLAQVIRPRLAAGEWVVCDRFTDATYAYQGGGRGMDAGRLAALEQFVHGDLQPDLTILFDLHPDIAQSRREKARSPDRFEAEQIAFFVRVRDAYLARAALTPGRFLIVDGAQPIESIRVQLRTALARLQETGMAHGN